MEIKKQTFFVENLGCAKNQVDAEVMIAALEARGWRCVDEPGEAGVVLVNTCGFVKDAKEESIKVSLEFLQGAAGVPVVMTGCLSQRYAKAIGDDLPELAGVFGNRDPAQIADFLEKRLPAGERVYTPQTSVEPVLEAGPVQAVESKLPAFYMPERTKILSIKGSAYVKVAEGCRNRCSFCAIPLIRGDLRSRTVDDVLHEIRRLAARGVREFNLIAQDLNAFGLDRGASETLALVKAISGLPGDFWVRPMYMYPDSFQLGILDICRDDPRILPYFDIPMQHASTAVLRRMGRTGSADSYLELVGAIRDRLPRATIRTSMLVGFPGETPAEFQELLDFQAKAAIDWLGVFAYSPEEGTLAAGMSGQVKPREAARRKRLVEEAQREICARRLDRHVGSVVEVLIEEAVAGEDLAIGRTHFQAPEVDGLTVVHLPAAEIKAGATVRVRLERRNDIDMEGVPHA